MVQSFISGKAATHCKLSTCHHLAMEMNITYRIARAPFRTLQMAILQHLQSHVRASESIIRITPAGVNEGVNAPTVAKLVADCVMSETDVVSALFKR